MSAQKPLVKTAWLPVLVATLIFLGVDSTQKLAAGATPRRPREPNWNVSNNVVADQLPPGAELLALTESLTAANSADSNR